jgi:predicted nucleic acid-binding protein
VTRIVLDTGPLVALLSARDAHHAWAQETIGQITSPLATCEAVLTEACFLLRHTKRGVDSILALVVRGIIAPNFQLDAKAETVRKLMIKYASVPMSLADACLVRMTELYARTTVLTLDDDFRVYRRNGRQSVPVLMPEC